MWRELGEWMIAPVTSLGLGPGWLLVWAIGLTIALAWASTRAATVRGVTRWGRRQAIGRLWGVWLHRDRPLLVLRHVGGMFTAAGATLVGGLPALLLLIVPMLSLSVALESRLGWRPVVAGEPIVATVRFAPGTPRSLVDRWTIGRAGEDRASGWAVDRAVRVRSANGGRAAWELVAHVTPRAAGDVAFEVVRSARLLGIRGEGAGEPAVGTGLAVRLWVEPAGAESAGEGRPVWLRWVARGRGTVLDDLAAGVPIRGDLRGAGHGTIAPEVVAIELQGVPADWQAFGRAWPWWVWWMLGASGLAFVVWPRRIDA